MAEQEIFRIEGDSSDAIQALQQLATALKELPQIVTKINSSINTLGTNVDKSLNKIETRVNSLNAKLEKSQQQFKETGSAITSVSRRANTLNDKMTKQGQIYTQTHRTVGALNTQVSELNKRVTVVASSMAKVGTQSQTATQKASSGISQVQSRVSALRVGLAGLGAGFMKSVGSIGASLRASLGGLGGGGGFSGVLSGLQAGFGKFGSVVQSSMMGAGKALQGFGKGLYGVHNIAMTLVGSVRMLAQGTTNLGRAMMFFVSLPILGFLGKMSTTVIDFEDAMVRTGKTTDMWGDDLAQLTMGIRELAKYTSSSHVELAVMAEQVGQLGVRGKDNIIALVDLFEKLTITTDITSDNVAKSMGKIGNAFGYDLSTKQGVTNLTALATTINRLENETAASADEIVTSMLKWAQAANQMRITAAEAAGLSATMIALGMSEEEAGTALKNASFYLANNIDELQSSLRLQDKYSTVAKTRMALDEDMVGVFLDLAEAAHEAGSQSEAMTTLMEIGNLRGGRALMAMATNIDMVRENLQRANTEWLYGNSLFQEYQRAMSSTKNQLGVLRNNLNDIGMTLGETFLPILNKIISVLIPALQELNKWFTTLSERTKIMAMGILLLVVVAGPVLFFFGQLIHAISLIGWGIGTLLGLLPRFIMFIGRAIVLLAGMGKAALLIPIGIVAGFALVLKFLAKTGVDIAGFFTKLADRAIRWGENLAKNFGQGFLAGAIRFIMSAVATVANWIAGFFESHSPPKKGPLRAIQEWGTALMDTYLQGFQLADFGILKDIAGYIEKILTMGKEKLPLANALADVAKARVLISNLIDNFNKTGQIAYNVLDRIVEGTGEYGKKLKDLLVTQLRYKQVQQELADIEKRREEVNQRFEDQIMRISRGGGDVRYKVSAIRAAKRERDDELRALAKREDLLEREEALLKDQVEIQKAILDALLEQEDIFQRIADIIESMKKAGGGAGAGGGMAFPEPEDFSEIRDAVEEAKRKFEEFRDRINDAKLAFQGFLDALSGKPMKDFGEFSGVPLDPEAGSEKFGEWVQGMERYTPLDDLYTTLYNIGNKIFEIKEFIGETVENIKTFWGEVQNFFGGVSGSLGIDEGTNSSLSSFVDTLGKLGGIALDWINTQIDRFVLLIGGFVEGISGTDLESVATSITNLVNALDMDVGEGSFAETSGELFDKISVLVGFLAGDTIKRAIEMISMLIEGLSQLIVLAKGGDADFSRLKGMWSSFGDWNEAEREIFEKGEELGERFRNGAFLGMTSEEIDVSAALFGTKKYGYLDPISGALPDPSEVGMAMNNWMLLSSGEIDMSTLGTSIVGSLVTGLEGEKDQLQVGINDFFSGAFSGLEWATIFPEDVSAQILAGIAGTPEQPKPWVENFVAWILGLEDEAELSDQASELGSGVITGLEAGIVAEGSLAADAAGTAAQEVIDKAREILDSQSPSGEFHAIGVDAMLGFEEGMLAQIQIATANVQAALMSWMTQMATAGKKGMYDLGYGMGSGFVAGIRDVLLAIAGRAPAPIGEYLSRIANALRIGSPSKVAEEMGIYFGQGFVNGVSSVMDGNAFAYSATNIYEQNSGILSPTIIIDKPVISDEADIDLMIDKIKDALAHDVYRSTKYGGQTQF